MPEWTGILLGKMHNNRVTMLDLANELGYRKGYVSMILNGLREPKGAEQKLNEAYESILAKRSSTM